MFQIQAAIAAVHDEAETVESTDWAQILALYELLLRMEDTPVVRLNHAVAVAMVDGPRKALALLERLDDDGRLREQHRLEAVRGHVLEMAGEFEQASRSYARAAEQASNAAERNYLLVRARRLLDGGYGTTREGKR